MSRGSCMVLSPSTSERGACGASLIALRRADIALWDSAHSRNSAKDWPMAFLWLLCEIRSLNQTASASSRAPQ
eukprot:7861585-Pyramimonas_sp.AAC.1